MSSHPEATQPASDLLSYEPFVRAIARALVSDEDRVGDVVQETWVRALSKPPQSPSSFKGWLARVARNLALDQYRRESNLKRREQVAAREEAVDVDERDLELHGQVVQAVLDLDEPYKSVVMLHYYRGLKLTQVAKELDRNAATVRSQLLRAHELLRGNMDSQFGGERASWMALCLPFAADRTTLIGALGAAKVAATLIAVAATITAVSALASLESELDENETHVADLRTTYSEDAAHSDTNQTASIAGDTDLRVPLTLGHKLLVTQDGAPVEGADVWRLVISDTTDLSSDVRDSLRFDPERLFRELGQHSRTGPNGFAPLEIARSDFAVLVAKGSYLKILTLDEVRAVPLEAKLEKVTTLAINTVDTRGNPIGGVPVILRSAEQQTDRDGNLSVTMSDRLIRVSEPHTGTVLIRAIDQFFPSRSERSWSVRLGVPGVASHSTRVDPERGGEDPLLLEVGDTGSVLIRTVDQRGEPLELQGTARLRSAGLEQATFDRPLVDGIARFPLVGVGSRLKLAIEIPAYGATWTSDERGPDVPGDVKTIVIQEPQDSAWQGTVVDAQGHPVDSAQLSFVLMGKPNEHFMPIQVATNTKGKFRVELEPKLMQPGRTVMLLHYTNGSIKAYASSEDALQLASETGSLGEFVMQETAGFIEGTCVSRDGKPLANIHVVVGCTGGYVDTHYTTGADGRFYLGGVFPAKPDLRIEPDSEWVLAEPAVAIPGQQNVRLTLEPGGSIAGTVLTDGAVHADQLKATAQLQGGETEVSVELLNGQFTLSGLRSGRYTFRVQLRSGELLYEVPDVVVRAPKLASDPRVSLIDLTGEVHTIGFQVLDSKGEALPARRATVSAFTAGIQVASATTDSNGHVVLTFASAEKPTVFLEAEGYRSSSFETSRAPETIRLSPGIPVALTSKQRPRTRSGKTIYLLSLVRMENGKAMRDRVSLPPELARDGAAEIVFPAPGRYQLFYSRHNIDPHHGPTEVGPDVPVTGEISIEVPDSDARTTLEIELPPEIAE